MTKDPATCQPNDSLYATARFLWDHDCGCIPVLDGGSRIIGMVTDRDICMSAYWENRPLREIPVSVAMAKSLYICKPDDSIEAAEQVMRQAKVRRLPVVAADGRLKGILSLNDIAREAARERDKRNKEVLDTEVAKTLSAVCEPGESRKSVLGI